MFFVRPYIFSGQYWLTSWGYKTELPVDNEKLVKLGREAADAIKWVIDMNSFSSTYKH